MSSLPTYIRVGGALYKLGGEAQVRGHASEALKNLVAALVGVVDSASLSPELSGNVQRVLRPIVNKLVLVQGMLEGGDVSKAVSEWNDARDHLPGVLRGLSTVLRSGQDPTATQEGLQSIMNSALSVDEFMTSLAQLPQQMQAAAPKTAQIMLDNMRVNLVNAANFLEDYIGEVDRYAPEQISPRYGKSLADILKLIRNTAGMANELAWEIQA